MCFSHSILNFFAQLKPPTELPPGVDVLWPFSRPEVTSAIEAFYTRFFNDTHPRRFLIGVNPGRFGAGVTGICFTDPPRLANNCGIAHSITGRSELSSDFVYRMITAYGGPERFYSRFYITSASPVGFLRDGKNLNYYDVKNFPEELDKWMARAMEQQLRAGADRQIAYSMGKGKNLTYLTRFNERHGFFGRIEALPHPRWVMQYRRKSLDVFIGQYLNTLEAGDSRPKDFS